MTLIEQWDLIRTRLKAFSREELVSSHYTDGLGGFCALGALMPNAARHISPELLDVEYYRLDAHPGGQEFVRSLEKVGIELDVASELQEVNDSIQGSDTERYVRVLRYVDQKLIDLREGPTDDD